jgi:hypothetical protein
LLLPLVENAIGGRFAAAAGFGWIAVWARMENHLQLRVRDNRRAWAANYPQGLVLRGSTGKKRPPGVIMVKLRQIICACTLLCRHIFFRETMNRLVQNCVSFSLMRFEGVFSFDSFRHGSS